MAAGRPVVCVQGLGWAGTAMAASIAAARNGDGSPAFTAVGVELPTSEGRAKVEELNAGRVPMRAADDHLAAAVADGRVLQNLAATTDPSAFGSADVTVVNVGINVTRGPAGEPVADLDAFARAIRTLGDQMPAHSLVVIASTVPPGTTELIAAPALAEGLKTRSLAAGSILLAYSYERVMPGPDFLSSITSYWRVYAGHTAEAAERCEEFLGKVIDVAEFPLTRLSSTTAAETAKIVENSYRAVTIAMMEEWGRFAETVGLDMFEIVEAVRRRPTHTNLREPGFGVGGGCLPTDPLLGEVAARQLLNAPHLSFPFAAAAVATNEIMPIATLHHVERLLGGDLAGKRLLLLGVAYRSGVADTRHSPGALFVRESRKRGASIAVADPLVAHWPELNVAVPDTLPAPDGFDAVIFAVGHEDYRNLDVVRWLGEARPLVFDAANVLAVDTRVAMNDAGIPVHSIGRGG